MNLSSQACTNFEHDISLFVDHELPAGEVTRLTAHLAECACCRDYVEDLREMADMHRDEVHSQITDLNDALRGLVDKHALFASITRRLLKEKSEELARLFYELGKSYVLAGNHAALGRLHRKVAPVSRPLDIRGAAEQARRVAREGEALAAARVVDESPADATGADVRSGSLFSRSRQLFSLSATAGQGALANGQRFLLAALKLKPDCDEARLYLGFHHLVCGRFDRAAAEFRRVHRTAKDRVHRLMALHHLGNVYATLYDYRRAIECYEVVVEEDRRDPALRSFRVLANLGMVCAKAGLTDRCTAHFTELVERYPNQVDESRQLVSRTSDFTALLQRDADLHETLRRSVPALFAA